LCWLRSTPSASGTPSAGSRRGAGSFFRISMARC
jgi:hypothetical protein